MRNDVITFLIHPHYHLLNQPIFIMNKDFELISKLEDEIDSMIIFIMQKVLYPFEEKFWENN
jgi:hypothetical protein